MRKLMIVAFAVWAILAVGGAPASAQAVQSLESALAAARAQSAQPQAVQSAQPAQTVAPTGDRKYQQSGSGDCGSVFVNCFVIFPVLTERVLVQRISCGFSLVTSASMSFANLSGGANSASAYLQTFFYGLNIFDSTRYNYGINSEVYMFFKAGATPTINIGGTKASVGSLTCTISGVPLGS